MLMVALPNEMGNSTRYVPSEDKLASRAKRVTMVKASEVVVRKASES
jgi:hypothetical protein